MNWLLQIRKLLLGIVLLLAVCGCGGDPGPAEETPAPAEPTPAEETNLQESRP